MMIATRYQIRAVRTIEDIRHARLLQLLDEPGIGGVQGLADKLGRTYAQISQWKNRSARKKKGVIVGVSNIDSDSARYIEGKCKKPVGWMDNDPVYDERPIVVQPPRAGEEPPRPDFKSRHVSDSEWALLQDLKVLPVDELRSLRERAQKNRENVERIIAERLAASSQTK